MSHPVRTTVALFRRSMNVLARFRRDRAASVAAIFALSLIPLVALIGLAVDFGRAYKVHAQTQSALDAAALAAGRASQTAATNKVTAASTAATAYFNQAKSKDVVSTTLQFSPNSNNTAFVVTATSWVKTPFLSVLKLLFNTGGAAGAPGACQSNGFGCVTLTTTATAALCPSDACEGSSGGSNVEVALMLDVTGSMCSPCSKIDALKGAAKDLIDIVIWDDQSKFTSKIALAPFADAVNVGTALAPQVRGSVTENTRQTAQVLDLSSQSSQPTSRWIHFKRPNNGNVGGCRSDDDTCNWQISDKCVTERIGAQRYIDASPAQAPVGKGYFGTDSGSRCAVGQSNDAEVNTIQPLTSDKTTLKRRIDKLATGGSTAGHLGTAWTWYLLSPNWNSLFPGGSAAGSYSNLSKLNAKGKPELRKIAVLMTDGDYNINYCKGVEAKDSDQSPDINCNSENKKSVDQAKALCKAMKDPLNDKKNLIEVFVVGFQVSNAAKSLLEDCATDKNHYYDALDAAGLQAAFRDIALKIVTLRLTN